MLEDGKELRWRAISEVMWVQDMGCTLAILLSEEGPQLCDSGRNPGFGVDVPC